MNIVRPRIAVNAYYAKIIAQVIVLIICGCFFWTGDGIIGDVVSLFPPRDDALTNFPDGFFFFLNRSPPRKWGLGLLKVCCCSKSPHVNNPTGGNLALLTVACPSYRNE